jgi:DNA-binding transcriptional LysR family regulator
VDRFSGMAVFVEVVDANSFAGAARRLGMSPAMVSTHIQALEQRLGVRLLNRTTRRVNVTEVGQDYYERSLRILADMEEAERAAGDLQTAPRGVLRVTTSVSSGMRYLGSAIADYLVAYPDVSVELNLDDRYVDLVEQRFDLAIRMGHLADSSLIARKLGSVASVLCASPAYLETKGVPQTPRDLSKHNCLIYTYATRQNVWHFFDHNGGQEPVRVSGRFLANNGDVLLNLALKDIGVILLPHFIAESDLKTGRLVRLLPDYETQQIPVNAVYPHSRYVSAKTRTFIDFIAARFERSQQLKHDGLAAEDQARSPVPLRVVS